MEKLLAIDPGGTCGYCILSKDGENISLLEAGQKPWKEFLNLADNTLLLPSWEKVVIEKYRIRRNTISANLGKNLRTVKIIGVLEFICEKRDIDYYLQQSGIGKEFFNRERLEEYGMWTVGKQHARDAIRHGLYFLIGGEEDGKS